MGADGSVDVESIPSVERPDTSWGTFFRRHFGPAMLWALVGVGASHLVLAPTLGATYGLLGIWVFALVYLAKYGAWELGIRYTYGVGRNPVEAYADLPGPGRWMQWYTLLVFTVAYTAIAAAVGMSTAAFLAAITSLTFLQSYVLLLVFAGALVLFSRYDLLETVLLAFTGVLCALLVVGLLAGPPSATVVETTAFDVGSLSDPLFVGLFAAVAGFAPTGFSTTVMLGSWATEKERDDRHSVGQYSTNSEDPSGVDEDEIEHIHDWIRIGRRDFNVGYAFSFILAIAMVLLGATVLYPEAPDDDTLALTIGNLLSDSLGEWSFYAVAAGAIAALYSTVITILDGSSRATASVLPMLVDSEPDPATIRRTTVLGMVLVSTGVVAAFGAIPVSFLLAVSVVLAVTEIAFYPANWHAVVTTLPPALHPSRRWVAYYLASLALVVCFGVMGAAVELGYLG